MWKKIISHSFFKNNQVAITTFLLCVLLVFFANSNKMVFVFIFAFLIPILLKTRSFFASIYLLSLFSTQFLIGKWYSQLVIPSLAYSSRGVEGGFYSGWGITPLFISAIILLLIMIREIVTYASSRSIMADFFKNNKTLVFSICSYLIVSMYSSLFVSSYPFISMFWFIYHCAGFLIFIATVYGYKKNVLTNNYLTQVIMIIIIFQFFIGVLQFIKGNQIGLSIEASQTSSIGKGLDDPSFSRPTGTFAHPNEYGLYQLVFTYLFLATAKDKYIRNSKIIVIFIGIVSILLSYSRSVWIAGSITLVYLFLKTNYLHFLKNKFISRYKLHFLAVISILTLLIIPRITLTLNTFYDGGGLSTRFALMYQALQVISYNPLFGSGSNTNEIQLFKYFPYGVISYFTVAVHMAYLQIAIDSGVIGLLFFCIFIVLILLKRVGNSQKFYFSQSAIIAILIYFLFQPHVAMVEFPLLGFTTGIILTLSKKHEK